MNELEKRITNIEQQLARNPGVMLDLDTSWLDKPDTVENKNAGITKIIVARHPGLAEWLVLHGHVAQETPVINHVDDPSQIAGCHVFGVLPLHLAIHAAAISEVALPHLPPEKRGVELGADEMSQYGACLRTYVVRRIADYEG